MTVNRKFLPNMSPINCPNSKGAKFEFTSAMEDTVRPHLAELTALAILVFPSIDWDAVTDKSRPFYLHCNANTIGIGATLEQEQRDGSVRPIVNIHRATLSCQ